MATPPMPMAFSILLIIISLRRTLRCAARGTRVGTTDLFGFLLSEQLAGEEGILTFLLNLLAYIDAEESLLSPFTNNGRLALVHT